MKRPHEATISKASEHLARALDDLLAAMLTLSHNLPHEPPPEALDTALADDSNHQAARAEFGAALKTLIDRLQPGPTLEAVYRLEETVNELVGQGAEVGWRLGQMTNPGEVQGLDERG